MKIESFLDQPVTKGDLELAVRAIRAFAFDLAMCFPPGPARTYTAQRLDHTTEWFIRNLRKPQEERT